MNRVLYTQKTCYLENNFLFSKSFRTWKINIFPWISEPKQNSIFHRKSYVSFYFQCIKIYWIKMDGMGRGRGREHWALVPDFSIHLRLFFWKSFICMYLWSNSIPWRLVVVVLESDIPSHSSLKPTSSPLVNVLQINTAHTKSLV